MLTQADVLQRVIDNRRVRWISAVFVGYLALEVIIVRTGTYLDVGRLWSSHTDMLITLVPLSLIVLGTASLALTFGRHQQAARITQILSLFLGGSAAVALNPTSTPASGTFYALAVFLANRYGLLGRHKAIKTAGLAVVFLASVLASAWMYVADIVFPLVGAVIFVPTYALLWFLAAEGEIRGLASRYTSARIALGRNKKLVDLGRGALGFVHTMSGRMVALEHAADMLRNGADREAALAKLEAARRDLNGMLTSLKLSMVHQSEIEPRELKLGDVLRGLVELAKVSQNGDGHKTFSLDVLEDVGLRAPPAEIYMLFETVLQNAVEAGASHVSITVGPGRSAVVANDGPPIPFCQLCKRHECMACREFRVGRSSKVGGSGIGMVVAREILSRYGSLALSSRDERTEVRFAFH